MRIARPARFGFVAPSLLAWLGAMVIACGGAATPPPDAPPAAEPPPAVDAAPAESAKPSEPAPAPTASGESGAPAPAAPAAEDPNATRSVTYVVVPEGLKITVAGVRFTVTASAAQIAAGWGAKVSVVASAVDGKPHSLSSPKAGPLAFAGSVRRKGSSEAEPFGDERAGDGEQGVFGDDATKFSRTWPMKGVRVLGTGDALDLQIALWGLGVEKEARRPVKQFCHVRVLVEKGKPRAVVEPPASASGK